MEFLPFEIDYLPDEIIEKAENELGETSEKRQNALAEMRELLDEEKNISYNREDRYLLLFLRPKKFNVKTAVATLKNYFHTKDKYHDVFGKLDYDSVVKMCRDEIILFLPYRDKGGIAIIIIQAGLWNPSQMSFPTLIHGATCALLNFVDRHAITQICGVKVILDVKGVNYNQVFHLSPRLLFLLGAGTSECFPIRFKEIHVFNESIFVKYVWNIIQLGLSEKLRKRVHFHSSNFESLHSKINPALLPENLGGTMVCDSAPIVKIVENNRSRYHEHIQYGFIKQPKNGKSPQ